VSEVIAMTGNVEAPTAPATTTASGATGGGGGGPAAGAAPRRRAYTTTLVVMAWNEIDGMRAIMPQVRREWIDQILVVDGGSTDGTIEYARECGYDVYVQKEKGIRAAYKEALPHMKGDVIITFSPDGNSVPEVIPQMLDKLDEGNEMVIASRYFGGAKSADDDILTGFGNWMFTTLVNVLFQAKYTDAMVIYRAYYKRLIHELELDQERWYSTPEEALNTRVSWEPILSCRAARRKLPVAEIFGDEPPRIGGERKLQIWKWGSTFLFQFIRDFFMFR
jgi:glycosyltransferase involved in cell wall biosynthesis